VGARERRVAENEATFRRANEELRSTFGDYDLPPGQQVPFICECGDRRCTQALLLGLDEYEAVRDDPNAFLIVPGHNDEETEQVVSDGGVDSIANEVGDRFDVVRKRDFVRDITEGSNPRA
jgi:hypothetical protein